MSLLKYDDGGRIRWVWDDGGRAVAGFTGETNDCVVRATAIATMIDYQAVYDSIKAAIDAYAESHRDRVARYLSGSSARRSPRNGVHPQVYRPFLDDLGWVWTPTMGIGTGTTVHLRADELPGGRLIVRCSKHVTAMINGVIHDTSDPARDGTRAVYGYWSQPERSHLSKTG